MRKSTVRRSNPGRKTGIRACGKTFFLHLPYSIGHSFSIGHVTFHNAGNGTYTPDLPIPESWTVTL